MSASTLSLLLERAEAERDAAAQALHAANAQAQAARANCSVQRCWYSWR